MDHRLFRKILPGQVYNSLRKFFTSLRDLLRSVRKRVKLHRQKKSLMRFWSFLKNTSGKYRETAEYSQKEKLLARLQKKCLSSTEAIPLSIKKPVDILLVSPPFWDVFTPFSALPCLAGALKEKHFSVKQIDLGILYFHTIFPEFFPKSSEHFFSEDYYEKQIKVFRNNPYNSFEDYINGISFLKQKNLSLSDLQAKLASLNEIQNSIVASIFDIIANSQTQNQEINDELINNIFSFEKILFSFDFRDILKSSVQFDVIDYFLNPPPIVGISITASSQLCAALFLVKLLRTVSPQTKILLGGSYSSILWKNNKEFHDKILNWADFLCYGEGETCITMLMDYLKNGNGTLDSIPNLAYKKNDCIHENHESYMENVTTLPVPCYDDLDLSLYMSQKPILAYQGSRGCFYGQCGFCSHEEYYRHHYRKKDLSQVIRDLLYFFYNYNVSHFQFVDEAIEPHFFKDIVYEMDKHAEFQKTKWFYYSRVSNFYDDDILKIARKNGCEMVMFGAESFSNRLLKFVKKGITSETTINNIKLFSKFGIKTFIWLLWDLPSESPEEMRHDIQTVSENRQYIYALSLSRFAFFPMTDMYNEPGKFSIISFKPGDLYSIVSVQENGTIVPREELLDIHENQYRPVCNEICLSSNRYVSFFNGTR